MLQFSLHQWIIVFKQFWKLSRSTFWMMTKLDTVAMTGMRTFSIARVVTTKSSLKNGQRKVKPKNTKLMIKLVERLRMAELISFSRCCSFLAASSWAISSSKLINIELVSGSNTWLLSDPHPFDPECVAGWSRIQLGFAGAAGWGMLLLSSLLAVWGKFWSTKPT